MYNKSMLHKKKRDLATGFQVVSTEDGHPPGLPWAGPRRHSQVTRTCKVYTARSPPTQRPVTPPQPCPHHPQPWLPMELGGKLLLPYLVLLHWHRSHQPTVLLTHLCDIRNRQIKLNSVVMSHTGWNHRGPTLGFLVGGGVRRRFPNPDPRPRPRGFEKQAGTTPWGCVLLPSLFNLYAEYIMRNAGLDEAQAGIKIARKNINQLRYADDTTLTAESKDELKSLLMKVKEESEKAGLKLNIQKTTNRLVITFLPRSKHLLISWLQSSSAVILEPPKIKSDQHRQHIKKQRHYFANRGPSSQSYGFFQ